MQDYNFTPIQNIVQNYTNTKSEEDADLFIALSHLGHSGYDGSMGGFEMAKNNYFFDIVIGGHSHAIIDTSFYDIPVFQLGANLHFLGKIELEIKDKSIPSFPLINLDNDSEYDTDLQAKIESYNDWPELYEEIGFSEDYHSKSATGCFYTNAICQYMGADVSFQNTGGIRSILDAGTIIKSEINEISPFNNGTVLYNMTVQEIKDFLQGSGSAFITLVFKLKRYTMLLKFATKKVERYLTIMY